MFCQKCGAQIPEGVAFCTSCGTPIAPAAPAAPQPAPVPVAPAPQPVYQQPVAPAPQPVYQQPVAPAPQPVYQQPAPQAAYHQPMYVQQPVVQQPQNKNKLILIIAAIAIVLVGGWFLFFGMDSVETPIKNFINGVDKKDYATFVKAYPDFLLDEFLDTDPRYLTNSLLQKAYMLEEFGDISVSNYSILSKEPVSAKKLANYQRELLEEYGSNHTLTEAYKVAVAITYTEDGDFDMDTAYFIVGKMDGKWKIIDD